MRLLFWMRGKVNDMNTNELIRNDLPPTMELRQKLSPAGNLIYSLIYFLTYQGTVKRDITAQYLADQAGCSTKTVYRCIAQLQELGLIDVEGDGQGRGAATDPNKYSISQRWKPEPTPAKPNDPELTQLIETAVQDIKALEPVSISVPGSVKYLITAKGPTKDQAYYEEAERISRQISQSCRTGPIAWSPEARWYR